MKSAPQATPVSFSVVCVPYYAGGVWFARSALGLDCIFENQISGFFFGLLTTTRFPPDFYCIQYISFLLDNTNIVLFNENYELF